MAYEFELNLKTKTNEMGANDSKEQMKEDRKDQRVDRQAGHQMNMIQQRKQEDSGKKFESSGNDVITGGSNMEKFGL